MPATKTAKKSPVKVKPSARVKSDSSGETRSAPKDQNSIDRSGKQPESGVDPKKREAGRIENPPVAASKNVSSKSVEKKADSPSVSSQKDAGLDPDDKRELTVSQVEDYLRDHPASGQRSVVRRSFPVEEYPTGDPVRRAHDKLVKKIEELYEEFADLDTSIDPVLGGQIKSALRTLRTRP